MWPLWATVVIEGQVKSKQQRDFRLKKRLGLPCTHHTYWLNRVSSVTVDDDMKLSPSVCVGVLISEGFAKHSNKRRAAAFYVSVLCNVLFWTDPIRRIFSRQYVCPLLVSLLALMLKIWEIWCYHSWLDSLKDWILWSFTCFKCIHVREMQPNVKSRYSCV